jgi:hypothetical protein
MKEGSLQNSTRHSSAISCFSKEAVLFSMMQIKMLLKNTSIWNFKCDLSVVKRLKNTLNVKARIGRLSVVKFYSKNVKS